MQLKRMRITSDDDEAKGDHDASASDEAVEGDDNDDKVTLELCAVESDGRKWCK